MSVRVEFRWPESLLGAVDAAAGDVPRSVWVRRAVEVALAHADGSLRVAAEREVAEKFGLHPPAEQPYLSEDELRERHGVEAVLPPDLKVGDEVPLRRVSPSKPIPPRVPFRRDVKPFQRGDK